MGQLNEERVRQALGGVNDPELGMSIVDLGLVYDFDVDEEDRVKVEMTLTTPGCPLGSVIGSLVDSALRQAGAQAVEVKFIWSPPWTPDMMSDEARMKLGWGIR